MSRIGKTPIVIPEGVKAAIQDGVLVVEGPKGKVQLPLHPLVAVTIDEGKKQILAAPRDPEGRPPKEARLQFSLWGTMQRLVGNMIEGVTKGYALRVQIVGVGYSAKIDKGNLVLRCGYANDITVPIPEGLTVAAPEVGNLMVTGVGQMPCTTLTFQSADKHLVGQFTACIRALRPPEPYKGKGIRYFNEEVKRKAGKALAAGTT